MSVARDLAFDVVSVKRPDRHTALRAWLRLLTCSTIVEREVRGRLRQQFETTLPRFDVLAQLYAAARDSVEGLTMSELSRRLMVTNGNLTGLIERLAQERLVSRAVSPHDRRTQIVRITVRGSTAFEAMMPEHEQWIETLFAGLDDGEQTQLYTLLGKLRDSAYHTLETEERS